MKGRTMYVVPYCMGPLGSRYSRWGRNYRQSQVVNENYTRMGDRALKRLSRIRSLSKGYILREI